MKQNRNMNEKQGKSNFKENTGLLTYMTYLDLLIFCI